MSSTPQIHWPQASTDTSFSNNSISSNLPPCNQSLGTQGQQQATLKHTTQPFPANIEIADDPLTATRFARAEYSHDPVLHESPKGQRTVLWSNSKIGTAAVNPRYGIGVTYMHSRDRWVDLEYKIQREVKDWVAKIAAISKALQIAAEEVSRAERKPTIVAVHTGSRGALERMKKGFVGVVPDQKFLLKPGILAAEKIRDCGGAVELRWGPDTEFVQGSRRARHAGRRGANYTPSAGQGDRVLEVQPNTKRARARARARSRPPAVVLPDVEVTGLGLVRLELRER